MLEPELDATTADGRAFLQHRVSRFGLVTGLSFLVYLAFRAMTGEIESIGDALHPSFSMHLAGGLSMIGVWATCRSGSRGLRFIRIAEGLGFLVCAAATGTMGVYMPIYHRPDLVITLALALSLFARAIYVPSTARRSAALGVLVGIIAVGSAYVVFARGIEAQWVDMPYMGRKEDAPMVVAVSAAVWWSIIITITSLASRVIYGLRHRLRETAKLGQYHLLEELGHGAMGVVYRASHAMLRRDTAIKLLKSEAATDEDLERFEREVRLTAKLTHPHTVTIFDYGRTPQGLFYYAMELLKGADLERVVTRDGPQPPGRVAKVLYEAASALAEAHGIGLVHRDIKPANIMLCEQGGQPDATKLVDFGLVRHLDTNEAPSITAEHVVVGTPYYMAPESFAGAAKVEARSDIYALGAVAYFMITGKLLFDGKSVMEVCTKHVADAPVPPSERLGQEVPEDLERLILDCLEKSIDGRPQTATELRRRVASLSCFGDWGAEDSERWWSAWQSKADESDLATAPTQMGTIPIDFVHRG